MLVVATERRDERDDERGGGEEEPLALRQPGPGEQHGGGREPPAAAVAQPEREKECAHDEQRVDEHVGLRCQQARRDAWDDEHQDERRPEEPRRHVPVQAPRDRGDGAHDEEPVLQVERGRRRRSP